MKPDISRELNISMGLALQILSEFKEAKVNYDEKVSIKAADLLVLSHAVVKAYTLLKMAKLINGGIQHPPNENLH